MFRFFITFLGVLVFANGFAQKFTGTLRGKVIDKDSKQPLEAVNVFMVNGNPPRGAATDENGVFVLNDVNVGRHTLRITYVGYDDVTLSELLVASGKETFLNIEMQEKVNNLKEVEVVQQRDKSKANNDFASVSVRSFSAEEMTRYAGTLNDPARMAQSFAGVMTSNDENNQIVVRGNSPRGLLWRLEGIEIPNPNHFAGNEGATGGGVSMLSANMITNTDFYSAAFPAEFGNALSSVFDLNYRKGNTERHEFTLQAGILGAEAALEGPFSKKYKGSYLVNYRYSTLELFALTGFKIGGDVTPRYQDVNFNFYFPTKKYGSFTLFGFGGLSRNADVAEKDTAKWETFSDKTAYADRQAVGMAGVTHLYLFKDNRTYLKTVLAYSYTNNRSFTDTVNNSFEPFTINNERFAYQTARAHVMLNSKLNAANTVRAGIIYNHYVYSLLSERFSFFTRNNNTLVNDKGNTGLAQAYIQWKHRFNDRATLNSGVHFTYSAINNAFYIEPRLGAEYRISEKQTLSLGAGVHSRMDAISTYVSYYSSEQSNNRRLNFTRALHAVAGYNLNFLKQFRFKTEAYFQYLFSVPVGRDSAQRTFSIVNYNDGFVDFPLVSTGSGINYGIELTLEKFFSQQYYFMFTTSLFDSRYRTTDGSWRQTAYNVNYVFNLLGGKEFTVGKRKNNIISLNTRIIWRGGQRFTPVDISASIAANETVYDEPNAFSRKLPDYFRMDFGASFRRNKKRYSWVLAFDAQNVINRQNVAAEIYNPETRQIERRRNLGIVPVVSWKVFFSVK